MLNCILEIECYRYSNATFNSQGFYSMVIWYNKLGCSDLGTGKHIARKHMVSGKQTVNSTTKNDI